jgi:hypothetical protein
MTEILEISVRPKNEYFILLIKKIFWGYLFGDSIGYNISFSYLKIYVRPITN